MRKEVGSHLKLYRIIPVEGRIVTRDDLEAHNSEIEIDDFAFGLVEEYVIS
jgi:hypothetical protein